MKKEEILAMEAGKALDILMLNTFGIMPTQVVVSRTVSVQVSNIEAIVAPVSTDISAAWLVVEKMTEGDRYFGLQRVIKNSKWLWEANFGEPVFALEAPEAICKAALIAKLGGEK